MGFDQVFYLLKRPVKCEAELAEIPVLKSTEKEIHEKVIAAHRVLMNMNEANRMAFQELFDVLQNSDGSA